MLCLPKSRSKATEAKQVICSQGDREVGVIEDYEHKIAVHPCIDNWMLCNHLQLAEFQPTTAELNVHDKKYNGQDNWRATNARRGQNVPGLSLHILDLSRVCIASNSSTSYASPFGSLHFITYQYHQCQKTEEYKPSLHPPRFHSFSPNVRCCNQHTAIQAPIYRNHLDSVHRTLNRNPDRSRRVDCDVCAERVNYCGDRQSHTGLAVG
jgi:hypothetical protein